MFFAYRDFTSDPDQILANYGFGRAHHRVLHFVNRKPGMTVAELLDMLKITKQSLARVLKQLIDTGHSCRCRARGPPAARTLYRPPRAARWRWRWPATVAPHPMPHSKAPAPADRGAIERFLKAMVNPELRAQIDNCRGLMPGKSHGDQ